MATWTQQTINSLYLAASDTLTTTLRWMTVNLARYPEVQARIREEITESLNTHGEILPTACPFLQSFLLENMRMFPVADTLPHSLSEDVHAGGFFIPRGSIVQGSLTAIMHDPNHFDDPDQFKSDRFLINEKFVFDPQVCNFSVGLRNCVGRQLAQSQYFRYAAELVSRFELSANSISINPIGRVIKL